MTADLNARTPQLAFIGGGNMASAMMGSLRKAGYAAECIQVLEPSAEQGAKLQAQFGVRVHAAPHVDLGLAQLVVWAVKPQIFKDAAQTCQVHLGPALHLSVAAGIRSDTLAQCLGSQRIVRAMPNTPALIGQGMTALFARSAVSAADQGLIDQIMQGTGQLLWLQEESQLDAVTALSGSGPAYVFYFLEAMIEAGVSMGLSRTQARQLATQTFVGASALAQTASEPPEVLRAQVTSPGGTTHAAISAMEAGGTGSIKAQFVRALQAAQQRAVELGQAF